MTTQWTRGGDNQDPGTKKDKHIDRLKVFLHREINTVHKFLCADNVIYMHVTCTAVTMHAICEGLMIVTCMHSINVNKKKMEYGEFIPGDHPRNYVFLHWQLFSYKKL